MVALNSGSSENCYTTHWMGKIDHKIKYHTLWSKLNLEKYHTVGRPDSDSRLCRAYTCRVKCVNISPLIKDKKEAKLTPPFNGLIFLGEWFYSVMYVVPVAAYILYHNVVERPSSVSSKVRYIGTIDSFATETKLCILENTMKAWKRESHSLSSAQALRIISL